MKRILAVLLSVCGLLLTGCAKREAPLPLAPKLQITMRGTDDKVQEFLKLNGDYRSAYEDDRCRNITPDYISGHSEFEVYKYDQSCESFLMYKGRVYPIAAGFGGNGITSLALADVNRDGKREIYYTFSFGSGLHRSTAGYFDPASEKETVFGLSVLNEEMMLSSSGGALGLYTAKLTGFKGFTDFELTRNSLRYRLDCINGAVTPVEATE